MTAVVAGAVTGSYGDMSGEGNPNDADAGSQYLALTGAALLGAALVILISIPDAPKPECGNGKREGGETCDDGNRDAHDGCDARCFVERRPKPKQAPPPATPDATP